jgi:DnaJ like chaperone protein
MLTIFRRDIVEAVGQSWLGRTVAWLLDLQVTKNGYDPMYGMLMHLAMSDGRFVADEGETLHRIMVHFAQVKTQEDELVVLQQLRSGSWKERPFREHCQRFARLSRWERSSRELALEALVSLAVSDGDVDSKQRLLIEEAREIFGLPSGRVDVLFARAARESSYKNGGGGINGSSTSFDSGASRDYNRQDSAGEGGRGRREIFEASTDPRAWAYEELECSPGASAEQIKQQYRRLAKQFHPDSLRARGASSILIEQGHQRFLHIQRAYETLQG